MSLMVESGRRNDWTRFSCPKGIRYMPPKVTVPVGGSGPTTSIWFLGPTSPNGISIGSTVFAGQGLPMCTTHTHTDHGTSVTIGRIFALYACDAA